MLLTATSYFFAAAIGFFIACVWIPFSIRKIRSAREYERESNAVLQEPAVEVSPAPPSPEEKPAPTTPYKRVPFLSLITRRSMLTDNEVEFYHRLTAALPDFIIMSQVSLSALIAPVKTLQPEERMRVFRKFSQKRADYAICAKDTLRVVALVELDDASHDVESDRKRDGLLRAGGYDVYRFQSSAKPSVEEIAARFKNILPKK